MDWKDEQSGKLEEIHRMLPAAYCQFTSTEHSAVQVDPCEKSNNDKHRDPEDPKPGSPNPSTTIKKLDQEHRSCENGDNDKFQDLEDPKPGLPQPLSPIIKNLDQENGSCENGDIDKLQDPVDSKPGLPHPSSPIKKLDEESDFPVEIEELDAK